MSSRSLAEVEVILTTERPRPPSRILRELAAGVADGEPAPKGVERIDTDLDHIVLKALRSDAAERYRSVNELAEDLRRFRTGRPILAREGNRRYQVKKFAQRHWRGLTVASLALILLNLFAIDRTIQVERRDRALAQAELSLNRSEGLWSFVENLFWQANPQAAKGRELTVAEAVTRGEGKLSQGKGGGPPEVEAMIHALFGRIRLDLGQYGEAESSLEKALRLFGSMVDQEESLRIAELRAWGDLALARLNQIESAADEGSEQIIVQVIASARRAYEQSRWLEAKEPALALELSNPLAEVYCQLERWQDAAPLTKEAMTLLQRARKLKSRPVADALARRALVLKNLDGDLEGAQDLYTQALDIYLELEGNVHPEVARLHNQLALVASGTGNTADALTSHQEALKVRRELYPGGHLEIRMSHEHLASLFRAQGTLEFAGQHFAKAAEVSRKLYGRTNARTIKYTLQQCEVLLEDGQPAKAEALLRTELTTERRAARPAGSRLIVQAEGLLGAALFEQGIDEGEALLHQSLQTLRSHPDHFEDVIAWFETYLKKISDGCDPIRRSFSRIGTDTSSRP
jgi:tetratricopeptide (TPR) repeat protein